MIIKSILSATLFFAIVSMVLSDAKTDAATAKLKATPAHSSLAPDYIANIDADASWQADISSYALTTGKNMIESEPGVLGTKDAKILVKNDADRPWSAPIRSDIWVKFDLGAVYDLSEIRIWNYQQSTVLVDRGIRQISITVSPSGNDGDWKEVFSGILPKGEETVPFGPSLVVPTKELKVRYVKITPSGEAGVGNWGNDIYAGLGQVRFYGKLVK